MYTIKINIAEDGSKYIDGDGVEHNTLTGHMWYSISNGTTTNSFGFAPTNSWAGWNFFDIDLFEGTDFSGIPIAPGKIYPTDDGSYTTRYYTGEIVITSGQYQDLMDFGIGANLHGFSMWYDGLDNSCIDYTWKALNIIGLNPSDFEGQTWPTHNADDADKALYKYLFGNTSDWNESLPDAGDYHAIYGSNGNDVLRSDEKTDAIYGGAGNDTIYGNSLDQKLYGGIGDDHLIGGAGEDVLIGGINNDTLMGTDGYGNDDGVKDVLNGGEGYDTYIAGNNDVIYDSDGSGIIIFEGKVLHGVDVTMDSTIYPSNQDHTVYYSKVDKGTYTRNGNSGFTFVADGTGHTLTVYTPLDYTEKIIPKPGGGTMKDKTYRGVGVILENFSSPLVLDLNHDGVTSLDLYATPAYFDMEKDGIREKTGWIQSTDALLAFDKNRDGIINDGSELFGNYTTFANGTKASNGFEALAQYDNNHDGVIDKNDAVYDALSAWIDSNQDGITDAGELHSLSELGVTSISLNATANTNYEEQNAITHTSSFTQQSTDAEGNTITETKIVNDVWFRKDSTNTLSTIAISDDVATLPQINGSGRVLDLHGAMEERVALKTAVENFMNSTATYADQATVIKNILALWSNTDNISTAQARGEQWILNHTYSNAQPVFRYRIYAYARDVAILEQFSGTTFSMTTSDGKTTNNVVDTQMAQEMTNRLNDLIDTTMIRLLGQKIMGDAFYDATGQADYDAMFTTISTIMESGIQSDKETSATLIAAIIHRDGFESLSHFDQSLLDSSDFHMLLQANGVTYTINADGTFSGRYKDTIEGGSGNDTLTATNSGTVYGGDGNDTIYGQKAADEHNNATGHEELHGGDGNDTIIGGTGDDILYGDAGDDTLYANSTDGRDGYGHDFLIGGEGNDTLVGTGRNSTYVYNYGDGNDTIIDGGNVGVTDDVLEFRGIRFEDIIVGSSGNNMVIRIKDIVDPTSDSGSITIKNGMNSGKIEQYIFDDITLNFTKLQLAVNGLLADDIYSFSIGNGLQTIKDMGSIKGDTLRLGDGITVDDIEIKVSPASNDLIVALKEDGKIFSELNDKLTITNWFNPDNRIETFSFSDGTTWDVNAILAHQGSDEADTTRLLDTTSGVTLNLGDGNDTITTGSGNDTLVGGTGNDTLNGGSGNDTYMFTKGDGIDIITDTSGIDTLQFGEGVTAANLITYVSKNTNNLIVAIKEDGIAFDQLSDKITLNNWFIAGNRIESFRFMDGTIWNVNDIISTQATDGDDSIRVLDMSLSTNIHLLNGNDTILSGSGNDSIYGDNGDDIIQTQVGDDTLVGGTGNDTLQGGGGNDTYIFNRGDGIDTITDIESYQPYYWSSYTQLRNGGNDTLKFGEGITSDDIIIKASANSNDLIVALKEEGKTFTELTDKITLKNWFNADNRIEAITFDDGTVWNVNDIVNAQGTEDADTVHLLDSTTDVTLNLGGGNDTVTTANGNDTLEGGAGNDTLSGGAGDDTYIFSRGDGIDTIMDTDGEDTLRFGEGITANDIIVQAIEGSDDLIVALKEDGKTFDELSDKIILKNWYSNENRIETFSFTSGDGLDTLAITELQATDSDDNYLRYLDHDNTINAHEGDDIIEGGAGNDIYLFNRGDGIDHITDITGMDTLVLGTDIASEDIEVHADNNYLIIGLKEDGKTFDELSDKVYFKRVGIDDYGIETLKFADGEELDPRSLISTYDGTDGNDTIDLAYLQTINPTVSIDDSLVINAKAGNDTVTVGNGSNTIDMGDGDSEILTVGDGDNQIDMGSGWNKSLTAGDGNNFIDTTQTDIDIVLGEGNNIVNAGYYTNLNAGSGDNTIHTMTSGYTGMYANFGDGNNTITEEDSDSFYGGEGSVYIDAGDGDNIIQIGQKLSKDLINDDLYRNNNISVGDGNNQISVKNGDGNLFVRTGSGNNTTTFSADVDFVEINMDEAGDYTGNADGDNTIMQLDDIDIEYSYYNWNYDEATASWYQSDELITESYENNIRIGFGNGSNTITLTDVAQNYNLDLGNGKNTITVGKEGSDTARFTYSDISAGDGDNSISVLSGDGQLTINEGSGNNNITLSSDLDDVRITLGDGDNNITQLSDMDNDEWGGEDYYGGNNRVSLMTTAVSEGDYYGGEDSYYNNPNSTRITLGTGHNTITLGTGNDTVELNYDAQYSDDAKANIVDVGSGSNTVNIQSDANHMISMGANNYKDLPSYNGFDYDELYLGDGDNRVTIIGADEIYAQLGEGDNRISITNTTSSYLDFDGGDNTIMVDTVNQSRVDIIGSQTNNIKMGEGSTLLSVRYSDENIIATGAGADDVYTQYSDDTYLVNIGDGTDAILDMYGTDQIIFGKGININSLKVSVATFDQIINNIDNVELVESLGWYQYDVGVSLDVFTNPYLVIQYSDNPADKLILVNWYDSASRIEIFSFADGRTISDHQIVGLIGSAYDDIVLGTDGENTLHGLNGFDNVVAGMGNDTYIFGRGDGHDTFTEEGGFDTIKFGENITKNDLILQKVDNNLLVSLKEDGSTQNDLSDTITVNNWFDASGRIERFTFSDGSTMELNEILSLVDAEGVIYYGTPDEDTMEGTDIGDIIMARESNDVINGNDGDDLLFGEDGDDTINGGTGNDLLYGGEGNDIYIIDRNMGSDLIFDQSGSDTLRFAEGIASNEIDVWYENNDLKVWVDGTEVTLSNWYGAENRIESFIFSNGEILDINAIINLQYEEVKGVAEGTEFDVDDGDETIYSGQNGDDTYRIGTYAGDNSILDLAGVDKIEFASSITPDMLSLSYDGDDLIIGLEGTNIRLNGWYTTQNRIEMFSFEDGTTLNAQNIIDLMSTDEDDVLRSLEEGSTIDAAEGDDVLLSGRGDDVLIGREGNDTYLITEMSGMDTIDDASGIDTIRFGAGITSNDLRITWIQGNEDILIQSKNSAQDGLTLKNWYTAENRIEQIIFSDGTLWNAQNILDAMGSDQDDVYDGFKEQANTIRANGGNDIVSTFEYDDTLYGGNGDDALDAGAGDDTLVGGAGNDLLFGGIGDDTYVFEHGFGKDMIFEDDFEGVDTGTDRIVFGEGIGYNDIVVKSFENDNNLYIGLQEDGKTFDELSNVITIKDWYLSNNRIESITFGNSSKMSLIDLVRNKAAQNGEAITALGEGGMLIGTEGNDILMGNLGDDFIIGLGGNDTLIGNVGDDTLIGGSGDDLLEGSEGNDTYFFAKGDGHDTVYDNATAIQEQYGYVTDSDGIERWSKIEHEYNIDGGIDTIYFGDGITSSDLIVQNDGFDLLITFKDSSSDELRVQDYYKPFNTIEFFGFSDGMIMSGSEFEALLFTPGNDDVTFVDDQDRILYGDKGNDVINGGSGNDIIDGAGGDDTLNGGFGDDTYLFGRGSGHDIIMDNGIGEWWKTRSGNDILVFKDGITADDLVIVQEGNDVIIGLKEEGKLFTELSDTVRIKDAMDSNNPFEAVAFTDGKNVPIEVLLIKNTPPEVAADIVNILQDIRILSGEVGATDIDGDVLTYTVSTEASHGIFNVDESGVWNYAAMDGYIGTDSTIITIDDGNGGIVTQSLTFDLKVSAPTIETVAFSLLEDNTSTEALNVVNPIGGTLTYEVLTPSSNGEFSVDVNGAYTYNPSQDYNGTDAVVIKVTNEYGVSTTSTLTFDIEAVNDAPTVETIETVNLLEDSTIATGQINANDVDNNTTLSYSALAVAGFTLSSEGSYSFDAANEAYQHLEEGVTQRVTIPVTIADEYNASVTTDIVFMVTGTNDKPIIEDITLVTVREDDVLVRGNILSTDVDDNATATYSITQTVAGFTLGSDGSYSFNPADEAYQTLAKDEIQEITISVTVTDDKGATDTKDLVISVIGTNDVPTVLNVSESFMLQNIRNIEGKVEAYDIDGDTLSYTVATAAQHGEVTVDENGNWHYKADGSFNGNDTATILVDDGYGGSVTSVLNFTVDGYIYEDGDLVIDEASGNDTLSMNDISKDELSFSRLFDNLQITVADQGVITLKNYFNNINAGVETLHTAQGDINLSRDVINNATSGWFQSSFTSRDGQDHLIYGTTANDLLVGNDGDDIIFGDSRYDKLYGGNGNDLLVGGDDIDTLYGGKGDDNLYGDLGNDRLYGEEGNDFLIGAQGSDVLYGSEGDDWISGGTQNDTLYGGKGNDTYHFEKGDGQDYIYDTDDTAFLWFKEDAGSDTITFGENITKEDISFTMSGGDLFIQYGENDIVQIKNQSNTQEQIERIELADGNYLTNDDIDLVVQQINSYGSDHGMYRMGNNDIQNNAQLMNIVISAWNV